jgi:D-beta-D-heptose 7-phosphate kinase/D-beta-D-heptose 1-phosphate adenosyltransferase
VVDVKTLEDRLGGAGNVARNLRNLGATVSLCGFVGDDDEAQVVYRLLEQDGISREGIMVDRTRPTCLKTRVIAHSQQVVRIDRESRAGVAHSLREGFAAVVDAQIDQSKALILSDYGKGAVSPTLMQRLIAAAENKRLGLGARPLVVDPHPANYAIYSHISVAKPNRKEAEAGAGMKIVDRATALEAGKILCERWDAAMVMITLGEDGLVIVQRGIETGTFLETVAREVFDVSGAGDTVTALFTAAMATGASVDVAGDLANIAAGVVVSEIGTAPISLERLKREIHRLSTPTS